MYCGSGAAGSRGRGGIVVVFSVGVEHPERGEREAGGDGGDGEVDAVMSVVSCRRWNTSPSVLRNHLKIKFIKSIPTHHTFSQTEKPHVYKFIEQE
jgi:hypothetical protein